MLKSGTNGVTDRLRKILKIVENVENPLSRRSSRITFNNRLLNPEIGGFARGQPEKNGIPCTRKDERVPRDCAGTDACERASAADGCVGAGRRTATRPNGGHRAGTGPRRQPTDHGPAGRREHAAGRGCRAVRPVRHDPLGGRAARVPDQAAARRLLPARQPHHLPGDHGDVRALRACGPHLAGRPPALHGGARAHRRRVLPPGARQQLAGAGQLAPPRGDAAARHHPARADLRHRQDPGHGVRRARGLARRRRLRREADL